MIRRFIAAILIAALSFGAAVYLMFTGRMDLADIREFFQYNPMFTGSGESRTVTVTGTNQINLEITSFALPAISDGFASGGGAIAERERDILVLSRTGALYRFADGAVSPLQAKIETNNAAYEAYAESQGFSAKPGTNIGYAGLGMRAHDLLLMADGTLLSSFTFWKTEEHCAVLKVARLSGDRWIDLFETTPCIGLSENKAKPFAGHQAGGRLVEIAPGKVLFSTGDFKHDGSRREAIVDDPAVDYGKIHLLDIAARTKTLYSHGHRNPQGLLQDSQGLVWSTEHGPIGGDELNLIHPGRDYGWPNATLGRDCMTCDWQQDGRHEGYEQPVFAWVPSIGSSNLIEVRRFAKAWDGDLLVASLKGEALHRLRIHDRRVQVDEPIAIGDRIRDIAQLADHRIALWTDSGHLMFIRALTEPSPAEALLAGYPEPVRALAQDCLACHSFDSGRPRVGAIGLWGVAGRAKAGTDFADYSPALIGAGGVWDGAALDAFLADPQGAVPGTAMAYAGIKDAALRAELIRFLNALK